MTKAHLILASLGTLVLGTNIAMAQQYIYPRAGQSPQQQQQDDYQCHQWATQQSGYDPTRATPAPPPSDPGAPVARGALRGAAGGAIIGGIADGDVGNAALAGAVLGGFRGARTQNQASQQQAAAASGAADAYHRAKAACMEGRGYTVK